MKEIEDINLMQFDALLKCVVRNTVKNYYKKVAKEAEKGISLSELSETETNQMCTCDEYESDNTSFEILGIGKVIVRNERLAEALEKLEEKKRNTILMHYFLDISDSGIAKYLSIARNTSYKNRKKSLDEMRKILEEAV